MTSATTKKVGDNYTFGHSSAVLAAHSTRTASHNAPYVLPYIKPTSLILDVGCGPGSITAGFAELASEGEVIGMDYGQEAIDAAEAWRSEKGIKNLKFEQGDCFNLKYPDDYFDIVHCHQVLIHVSDPIRALTEMRRVCKKGGIVAAREGDFGGMVIHPHRIPYLKESQVYMGALSRAGGGEPNAGRHLKGWALSAGFKQNEIKVEGIVDVMADPAQTASHGKNQALRLAGPNGQAMVDKGVCTEAERQACIKACEEFAKPETVDAYLGILSNQILCFKGAA